VPAYARQGKQVGRQTMFISLIIKGGPVMIPIIALSIIGLALILELQRYLNWEFSIEL
jgi:biopolymer transport protein ExbB/TolQ